MAEIKEKMEVGIYDIGTNQHFTLELRGEQIMGISPRHESIKKLEM